MAENRPQVSIGMPVYNGEPHLQDALDSLLAQTHGDFELVIRDNASTDGTQQICRRAAAAHGNVRYTRNAENLGPVANFCKVLEDARGKYFMWAAHDDLWSPGYVSALAAALEETPQAVLATARTVQLDEDAMPTDRPDEPPAGQRSALANLRVLYSYQAASWIYGLYHTDWLRAHVHEFETEQYPVWSSDILWLASIILRRPVTGSAEATISKRNRPNSYAPRTETESIRFALGTVCRLTKLCRKHSRSRWVQAAALPLSWHYAYRRYFRKGNPFKMLRRLVMLPPVAMGCVLRRLDRRGAKPSRPRLSQKTQSKAA